MGASSTWLNPKYFTETIHCFLWDLCRVHSSVFKVAKVELNVGLRVCILLSDSFAKAVPFWWGKKILLKLQKGTNVGFQKSIHYQYDF